MAMGLFAGALAVVAALFAFMSGCGESDALGTGGSGEGDSTSVALPPIDLAAPSHFRTASFALG